ncbi:hypothetical protein BKA65DRAFT_477297 [Rhexocercosporidium sp. MPI-PUGE-AT-0058]|nr:hypothetical protein BKA65DRAFT_477297 [Rhexocercosporidium sp. MPI-PUGE-AT-0058]
MKNTPKCEKRPKNDPRRRTDGRRKTATLLAPIHKNLALDNAVPELQNAHVENTRAPQLILGACLERVNINVATGNSGPVRLFATCRKDNFSGLELRTFAVLQERQLSQNVLVTVGELPPKKLFVGPSWSILLEMYALKDSSAEEAGILRLREVESHATCEANFSTLRKWLQLCKRKHEMYSLERIKQLVGTSCMPKRLIDLGASDASSSKPKIIHTRGRQEHELQKSIPVEKLPQTIRDAFLVAQKLDTREAKRMGAIYANSYFTIAATAAKDSGESFLWARTLSRVPVPFRRSASSESEGTVYFRQFSDSLRDHQEYVLDSPLQKRAWVLQEMLLPRRIVHFSSKQIYWECRGTFGSEDDTTSDVDYTEHARKFLNGLSALQVEGSQLRGALKLEGQIGPCYVSLDLQPQPKVYGSDRKLKDIPITPYEYIFAEDKSKLLEYQASIETSPYDLYDEAPVISLLRIIEGRLMSARGPGERNVCRFGGERGTETDVFYLRLSCTSGMKFHHCRGLLLRCASGATGLYERVGVGWSTDRW